MSFCATIPIRTSTPGNNRKHWAVAGREARTQRKAAWAALRSRLPEVPFFPVKVKLTRLSPRKMDRHNLPGALKHVIDGIADFYGVDDGDERWVFEFAQEKGKMGVRVEIRSLSENAEK